MATVAWSFSYLQAYEQCPRRFELTKIKKLVTEPQTEQTMWGNQVHKALELRVKENKPLEDRFKQFEPIMTRIIAADGRKEPEQKFGITADFRKTTFFAKDVWCRGILDLSIVRNKSAILLDYKTGKPKSDGDQMRLFAATAFTLYPWIERADTGYLWIASDKIDTKTYTREDVPAIWDEFAGRVRRIEIAIDKGNFPPNPSGLCKGWCPVGKQHCEFWEEKPRRG